MINDILDAVREYWWLILGVGALIAFGVNFIVTLIKLSQNRIEASRREYHRRYLRFITGTALSVYVFDRFFSINQKINNKRKEPNHD
jgi:hypothetical protein